MASIREIKQRMNSISQTRQITNAMKLISASRLKRAQQQLNQMMPYFTKIEQTMADILSHSGGAIHNVYFEDRWSKADKTIGLVLVTGDKGLAGGYNHNIIKLSEDLIRDAGNPTIFVLGQMGRGYFLSKNYNVYEPFESPVQNPTVRTARRIVDEILPRFRAKELDEVYMSYTEMVSPIKLVPQAIKLLPLNRAMLLNHLGADPNAPVIEDDVFNYEPSKAAVFNVLVPKFLKGIIYGALVQAYTSELSARMSAMDNATENATEMIQELNLHYNRARQSAITQEISEIVGGASAL
jgi:F-type H+-transporting ATPase subunit gamma